MDKVDPSPRTIRQIPGKLLLNSGKMSLHKWNSDSDNEATWGKMCLLITNQTNSLTSKLNRMCQPLRWVMDNHHGALPKAHQGLILNNSGIDHPKNSLNLWALLMGKCSTFTQSSCANSKSNRNITKNTISSILTIVVGFLDHSLTLGKKIKQHITKTSDTDNHLNTM